MRDATEIESRGTPAVAVITEPFRITASSMAERQGYAGFEYVRIEHPLASLDDDAVRRGAKRALPEVLAVLGFGPDGEGDALPRGLR